MACAHPNVFSPSNIKYKHVTDAEHGMLLSSSSLLSQLPNIKTIWGIRALTYALQY